MENPGIRINKKIVTLVVGIIALAFLAILSYLAFFSGQKIQIINQSKHFDANYKFKEMFEKDLEEWGFWETNGVRINLSTQQYTIDKLQIVLTDQPQTLYKLGNKKTNLNITASGVEYKDGVYILKIYLHPSLKNAKLPRQVADRNEYINGFFLWSVINAVYNSTHVANTLQEKSNQINAVISRYQKDPTKLPFSVNTKGN